LAGVIHRIFLLSSGVLALEAALVVVLGYSAICAVRWLQASVASVNLRWRALLSASGGIGFLVLGLRLHVARGRISWAPYLDQWYAEIREIMLPYAHGTLTINGLFAGNNEHRIVLTRALSLLLVTINGEWDNRVTVIAMFVLQSLTVAWLCGVSWLFFGWIRGSLLSLVAILPMLLICDWENIVSGFQTQFGFLILGSVVAFAILEIPPSKNSEGWGAITIGILVLGSMASGLLTSLSLAFLGFFSLYVLRRRLSGRDRFYFLAFSIAAVGWITRSRFDPGPIIKAQSLLEFMSAFLAYGSWPLPPTILGIMLLWIPTILLFIRILMRRDLDSRDSFVLVLGFWVLLQAGALAWSRAGLSNLVSSRYTEVLSLSVFANTMAVLTITTTARFGNAKIPAWLAAALWIVIVAGAQVYRSEMIYRSYFDSFSARSLERESRLLEFTRSDDQRVITETQFPHIPCPAEILIPLMRDKSLRRYFPAPIRREIARGAGAQGAFATEAGPLSFLAVHSLRNSWWFTGTGFFGLICAFFIARKEYLHPAL